MTKEVKKITLGSIFSWVFGILFLLAGVGSIPNSPIAGIIIILCSAMIIPYFNHLIAEKWNIKISGGVKFLLTIIIFIAMGFAMANDMATQATETQPTQNVEETTQPTPPQKEFTSKTYDDLWKVFNPDSKYTDLQKEQFFNENFKNKYVEWTGTVKDVDASILNNLKLYIEQRSKGDFDFDGGDLIIYMNKNQYDELIRLSKGDVVTYSARMDSFVDLMGFTFYLKEGELTP